MIERPFLIYVALDLDQHQPLKYPHHRSGFVHHQFFLANLRNEVRWIFRSQMRQ